MSRGLAGLLTAAAWLACSALVAEQVASYRAAGEALRLFEQYDNDGYSLAVAPVAGGGVELSVRVSDSPLESRAPFPTGLPRDRSLPAAGERDAFASGLAAGAKNQADAVERILTGLAAFVRYDPDRVRRQEPSAVFHERRANCVGLSELAVDLLRRVGISARTVQGILKGEPGSAGFDAAIGGAYHRWIEVHYPDRGYVFSDPSASINGVDARYLPFGRRAYSRPRGLQVTPLSFSGPLAYRIVAAGGTHLRVRPAAIFPAP